MLVKWWDYILAFQLIYLFGFHCWWLFAMDIKCSFWLQGIQRAIICILITLCEHCSNVDTKLLIWHLNQWIIWNWSITPKFWLKLLLIDQQVSLNTMLEFWILPSLRTVSFSEFLYSFPSPFTKLDYLYSNNKKWNTHLFEDNNVQNFINSTGLHFDVIVMEEFSIDSFLMFGHKFKAPVVTICKFYCNSWLNCKLLQQYSHGVARHFQRRLPVRVSYALEFRN